MDKFVVINIREKECFFCGTYAFNELGIRVWKFHVFVNIYCAA